MAVQFSPVQRAAAAGVASAGLLIAAFALGVGQASATPAAASDAAGNAALIWLPATDRRRRVIVSCSLTWYPLGTPELLE